MKSTEVTLACVSSQKLVITHFSFKGYESSKGLAIICDFKGNHVIKFGADKLKNMVNVQAKALVDHWCCSVEMVAFFWGGLHNVPPFKVK